MPAATRDRILEASAELFRRQGYAATGMKEIAAGAAAPFGSIYHFFPGGKDDLSAAVIRTAGRSYGLLIPLFFDDEPDVAAATCNLLAGAADVLRLSDYADACPIATVALEVASSNEPLRVACAEVFESWIVDVTARYAAAGVAEVRARELAIAAVALLEGGFMLARVAKDPIAVEIAGQMMFEAIRAALAEAGAA